VKKTRPLKIVVPRAKASVERPLDAEVASAKHVKRTKRVVSDSPKTSVAGRVGAGASSSKAPAVTTKNSVTSIKGRRVKPTSMLEAASPEESQESSPHSPLPRIS
jgi:hypothetical protein